jgi:hypothetical protein
MPTMPHSTYSYISDTYDISPEYSLSTYFDTDSFFDQPLKLGEMNPMNNPFKMPMPNPSWPATGTPTTGEQSRYENVYYQTPSTLPNQCPFPQLPSPQERHRCAVTPKSKRTHPPRHHASSNASLPSRQPTRTTRLSRNGLNERGADHVSMGLMQNFKQVDHRQQNPNGLDVCRTTRWSANTARASTRNWKDSAKRCLHYHTVMMGVR